jgi:SAM-dependent methyltransferase
VPAIVSYRARIGPAEAYDVLGALQFNLLTTLGLREHHLLLDIGCGSLRAGRLFIPYLLAGRYFGVEPARDLVEEGLDRELGSSIVDVKQPTFSYDADFRFGVFGKQFDFLLAQSVFSHLAPEQIRACLASAREVMGPEAIFVATYEVGERDYSGPPGYEYEVSYTPETFAGLVSSAGLSLTPIEWPHPSGLTWVLIHAPAYRPPSLPGPAEAAALAETARLERARYEALRRHPYVRLGLSLRGFVRAHIKPAQRDRPVK